MLSTPRPEIEQESSPGERLVWSGQPHCGIRFRISDWIGIPFSVFWCGFAIFWEVMALTAMPKISDPVTPFFPLFGVPFILIGLYLVFGRFIVDARVRARTYYGLTDERIIITGGLFGRRTKSLNLRTLSDVSLSERADGSATITFGPSLVTGPVFPSRSWPGARRYAPPAFEMIDSAGEVYDLVRQGTEKSVASQVC